MSKYHTFISINIDEAINYRLILFDNRAPQPNYVKKVTSLKKSYLILTWKINGVFYSPAAKEYYNDVVDKLVLILNGRYYSAYHMLNGIDKNQDRYLSMKNRPGEIYYNLCDFSAIEDLRYNRSRVVFHRYSNMSLFKRVRYISYGLQLDGVLTLERVDEIVHKYACNYSRNKGMAKYIYNWIVDKVSTNDFYVGKCSKRISLRNRRDNAIFQNKNRFIKNYDIFESWVRMFGVDHSIVYMAKILKFSRPTIYKYRDRYLNLISVNSRRTIREQEHSLCDGLNKFSIALPYTPCFSLFNLNFKHTFFKNYDIICADKKITSLFYLFERSYFAKFIKIRI